MEDAGKYMEDNSVKIAKALEDLLFPSRVITYAGVLLLVSLGLRPSDVIAFLIGALIYKVSILCLRNRIIGDELYVISGLISLASFFIICRVVVVSKELIYGALSLFLITLIIYIVRRKWKISGHVAASAGAWTTLILVNTVFFPMMALIPLVAWSRLKLRAHTLYQVLAGAVLGFVIPLYTYLILLRGVL